MQSFKVMLHFSGKRVTQELERTTLPVGIDA